MAWVELITPCRVTAKNGRQILHYPGDVVEIKNKSRAVDLIKRKMAIPVGTEDATMEGVGIIQRSGGSLPEWVTALGFPITKTSKWDLPFRTTIFWHPIIKVQYSGARAALRTLRLSNWEIAVPIYSYTRLSDAIGTREEREDTKKIIHDLRVPAYEINFMFVKKNARTDELFLKFREHLIKCKHERHAFLRALYQTRPYLLPLPVEWARKRP